MSLYFRKIEGGPIPVLILHGVFGSSDNWLTVSKQIANEKYTVYLVDQRNHGRSPHFDKLDYPSMAGDLREFVREHRLENPVLIGHSMGGKTVMEYAAEWGDEIRRLVVVDIGPKAYPVHHTRLLEGLSAIPLADLQSRQQADDILSAFEPSLFVRQFLLKNLFKAEDGSFAWRLNLPVVKRDMPLVGDEIKVKAPLRFPALFIRGAKSDYILDTDWEAIVAMFPEARLVTIPGAGHWVQAEQPALFLEALNGFLNEP
ncbi:alpha/beta fold hydrolase [Ravibacter arvi]|uniref:Alpha/beta fold hydrolase n=1 Tax=Ravibacter arvi TaxID=2051041 RepID=A0ABP8LSV6_9BACT